MLQTQVGQPPDQYLLAAPDFPFVQDGYRDGEHVREAMHARFVEQLARQGTPWSILTGSAEDRLARAISLCHEAMARKRIKLSEKVDRVCPPFTL